MTNDETPRGVTRHKLDALLRQLGDPGSPAFAAIEQAIADHAGDPRYPSLRRVLPTAKEESPADALERWIHEQESEIRSLVGELRRAHRQVEDLTEQRDRLEEHIREREARDIEEAQQA